MSTKQTVLEIRDVSKHYGRVVGLDHLDLELRAGEVLGIIGQNGSGKSTLLKILAGLQAPDSGALHLRGTPVQLTSAAKAAEVGIGMVHQEQSLVPNLTVAENIFLDKTTAAKRHGLYRWRQLRAAAQAQLDKVGVAIRPETIVEDLGFAQRQLVELAKVLAIEDMVEGPPVILFDEPTSVLTPEEIAVLFREINRLRHRATIVFVSHRLDEIMEICDRVVVMTNGRKVADRQVADVNRDELYQLMIGHQRQVGQRVAVPARGGEPHLCVKGLSAGRSFRKIDLDVAAGEIVGLVGVLGSGAEEFCRALFGAEDAVTGEVSLKGRRIAPRSPQEAVALGIGYLPANRRAEGLLSGRSLTQNMVLTFGLEYGRKGIWINHSKEAVEADKWMARLKVKTLSGRARIEQLSGGNQQKVILGKWLMSQRLQLLLLDHPTRGLDPGARDDLFEAIREQARAGLSVIFVADTSEEVLELADRVIVLRDGEVTARFDLQREGRPSEKEIVQAMV